MIKMGSSVSTEYAYVSKDAIRMLLRDMNKENIYASLKRISERRHDEKKQ